MKFSDARGKLKIGSRFIWDKKKNIIFTVLALDVHPSASRMHWDIITDSGCGDSIENGTGFDWDFSGDITILDDEPDWRKGECPIPREELRVGMRIKINGLVETILGVDTEGDYGAPWDIVTDGNGLLFYKGVHGRACYSFDKYSNHPIKSIYLVSSAPREEYKNEPKLVITYNAFNSKPSLGKKIMSEFNKFVDAIKVAKMSEADQLLFKAGLKDIEGNYTSEFRNMFELHMREESEKAEKKEKDKFALTLVEQIREGKKLVEGEEKK